MEDALKMKVVRIDRTTDEKLTLLARRNHLTKSKVAERLIDYHYSRKIGLGLPQPEDYGSIVSSMQSLDMKLNRLSGASERIESFIKSLLLEERSQAEPSPAGPMGDQNTMENAKDAPRLTTALALLDRLLSVAAKGKNYDGNIVMQIRLSPEEFQQIRMQYEELCTSRII